MNKSATVLLAGMVVCALTAVPASAVPTYGFQCVTNNSVVDAGHGQAQLSVEVWDRTDTAAKVGFRFINNGPEAMSITDIYFDDAMLLDMAGYAVSSPYDKQTKTGVLFVPGANPVNLPGANTLQTPFVATDGLSSQALSPASWTGVNPGEWLEVIFTLHDAKTYSDVLTALHLGFADPAEADSLRIGIHVQGFNGGGSEAFIAVPSPSALTLGAAGIGLVGWLRRRKGL